MKRALLFLTPLLVILIGAASARCDAISSSERSDMGDRENAIGGQSASVPGPALRQDEWRVLGPGGGGTMVDPTISPHDPRIVAEHCDMTGAYITLDGAQSWRMFNLGTVVQTFAFDPNNAAVLYAGTYALWRSEDTGLTWSMIFPDPAQNTVSHMLGDHADSYLSTDDSEYPSGRARVQAIAVDPGDSNRIYAAFGGQGASLMVTEDGGRNWSALREFSREEVHALHIGPERSGAGSVVSVVCGSGVHRYAGDSWEHFPGPSEGGIQAASVGEMGDSGDLAIYALMGREGRNWDMPAGVYVSMDGGVTWTNVGQRILEALPEAPEGRNYRFRGVACAGQNAGTAYVGFSMAGERPYWRIAHSGIVKTTDGGNTWRIVFEEADGPSANLEVSWIEGRAADESIWFDAPYSLGVAPTDPNVCYATDLFRTYRTLDGGETWQQVNSVRVGEDRWTTRGLDVTTCYGVHFDPFDVNHVFITYTDIGMFQSADGGASWMGSTEGIPGSWRNTTYWIEFDPEVEGLMWGVFSGTHDLPRPKMWRNRGPDRYQGGVGVSTDGGRSWTVSNEGMPQTAATQILLDPTSPVGARVLYVCGFGRGVYKSTDSGRTWELKNEGIEGEQPFAWRMTRSNDGTLYLVVARRSDDGSIGDEQDGALYKSTDGAGHWVRMNLPEGVNGPNDLAVDPRDNQRLYLVAWGRESRPDDVGGGVFVSTDGGVTWSEMFAASQHVYAITIDSNDPNVLYICGFNSAAYRSTDRGETWTRIRGYNFKWGHRVIPDPADPAKVYIATFGGSLWHGPAVGDPEAAEDIVTPVPSAVSLGR